MTYYLRFFFRKLHIVYKNNDIVIARLIARGFQSMNIHMKNFEILSKFMHSDIYFDKIF